ncbi:2-hydroxyacid dehydrogenase [Paracandidimonas soli]|uniref:Glyoxylate/hydroxypyruvate reductase A n=1 Tax=Paracandidimonas soli TaxID=1917182 RepID=A0A4R3VGK2_9BURK|nr:glyoxylate/hydroxypyruvate reductase A [Paracandidimonas soli]TCV02942.1 glyoxylate/hydroxypyruvate reductase A [Paracandidimonas soli]
MSLVLIRKTAPTDAWLAALHARCPDLSVHVWPDTGPREQVEFVLTWAADPGVIAGFPNLKAIFSLGAGVDHVLNDPTVPAHLPVIRMIDPSLTQGMVQYVTLMVLQYQRSLAFMQSQQRAGRWIRPQPGPRRIGIMGMGELGSACARSLAALGYDVAGWSRRPRQHKDIASFYGADGLTAFLARTDILISLLPCTPELENILNQQTFSQLPRGAYLINAGRGELLVEEDLIAAIDAGQMSGAALDVFRTEPLPDGHPFWTHPAILVTPHIASMTSPATAVEHIAVNIARIRDGLVPHGLVDRKLGY